MNCRVGKGEWVFNGWVVMRYRNFGKYNVEESVVVVMFVILYWFNVWVVCIEYCCYFRDYFVYV